MCGETNLQSKAKIDAFKREGLDLFCLSSISVDHLLLLSQKVSQYGRLESLLADFHPKTISLTSMTKRVSLFILGFCCANAKKRIPTVTQMEPFPETKLRKERCQTSFIEQVRFYGTQMFCLLWIKMH